MQKIHSSGPKNGRRMATVPRYPQSAQKTMGAQTISPGTFLDHIKTIGSYWHVPSKIPPYISMVH